MAQQGNRQQLVAATETRLKTAAKAVQASSMALAAHGIDPKSFSLVIREALLNNPDIVNADERSLAQAVRKCCRDLIIPDGDRGAIVIFGGKAVAIPMVAGLEQGFIEQVGGEIRSGVVHEGDDVVVVEGINPTIEIKAHGTDVFKQRTGDNIVGSWTWLKFPWEDNPRLVLFTLDDINRAKAASKAQSGPWKTNPVPMARKSCIKSAIWRHRAIIRAHGKGSRLLSIIEEDNAAEYGEAQVEDVVIEGSATEVAVLDLTDADAPADQPKKRRGRPPKNAQAEDGGKIPPADEPGTTVVAEPVAKEDAITSVVVEEAARPSEGNDEGFLPISDQDDPGFGEQGSSDDDTWL